MLSVGSTGSIASVGSAGSIGGIGQAGAFAPRRAGAAIGILVTAVAIATVATRRPPATPA
jgi:hypothetical protein